MITEVKVTDFPSQTGEGFVDYVLTGDDGIPLAVVKELSVRQNQVQAGQQQAKLYADSLEKQYGRRPIIFYSNGYRTFMGRWCISTSRTKGFYTQQELNRLIQQRATKNTEKSLSKLSIKEEIVERAYQVKAVKSMLKVFEKINERDYSSWLQVQAKLELLLLWSIF